MRLIDGDALAKILNDFWLSTSPREHDDKETALERAAMCRGIDDCIKYVHDSPTVSGWVSVKDRMPCENPWESKWVLVWFGEESALHTEAPLPAKWNPNERTWWIVGFSDKYEGMKLKVTHWMLLPEPPEEVSWK